jgi:hypothetical protein
MDCLLCKVNNHLIGVVGYTKNVRLVEKVDNIIEISQIQSKISFHLKQ